VVHAQYENYPHAQEHDLHDPQREDDLWDCHDLRDQQGVHDPKVVRALQDDHDYRFEFLCQAF
jgi:hypothetical protein